MMEVQLEGVRTASSGWEDHDVDLLGVCPVLLTSSVRLLPVCKGSNGQKISSSVCACVVYFPWFVSVLEQH